MKYLAAAFFICFSISTTYAQHNFPWDIEQSLSRLEKAFNTADTRNLGWDLPAAIRMRIEDSVYATITDTYVMDKLHRYLAEKDSLSFKFTGALTSELDGRHTSGLYPEVRMFGKGNKKETVYIATGTLFYKSNGQCEKVEVTAYLVPRPEKQIAGIDISRSPRGSAFFTAPYR